MTTEKVYEGRLVPITADRYVEHYGWDRSEAEAMIAEDNTEARVFVVEGEEERELENVRQDESPDGFSWGYPGSAPTALAYSILADHFGGDVEPERVADFRERFIESRDQETGFTIRAEEIDAWAVEAE
jgi:hypothetical protein